MCSRKSSVVIKFKKTTKGVEPEFFFNRWNLYLPVYIYIFAY